MDIAVIGGYGVGQVFRVARFPDAGESVSAGSFEAMHGGKGSNQAVAASMLGARVALLSAVGQDLWAARAHELWRSVGVDDRHVLRAEEDTMVGAIVVDDAGENRIVIAPGALARLDASHAEAFHNVIAESDLLVVSLEVPMAVAEHAMRVARGAGTPVLLNPAPFCAIDPEVLRDVDYLTPNRTEAALIAGLTVLDNSPERIVEALRALTSATIAMTLGAEGVLVSTPDGRTRRVSAVPPRGVVDTTGAGDSFTAALAVAICSGVEFVDAVEWAAAAGSHTVAAAGVIEALPTAHDLPPLTSGEARPIVPLPERKTL